MNIAEFAKQLSHELHAGQFRNDGKTPYTVHTDWVGDNALRIWKSLNYYVSENYSEKYYNAIQAVGFLHDVVEDVFGHHNMGNLLFLGRQYGSDWSAVYSSVIRLSRFSKEDNVIDYLKEIKSDNVARIVKLTDLEHNLSDLKAGNLRDKYMLCQNFLLSD